MTHDTFAERLTMTASRTDENPNMSDSMDGASRWLVTFSMADKRMIVPYSMGSAHRDPPTAGDVLGCLAIDSQGIENAQSFEDWADEYGYDHDSRKAEKTYRVCQDQAAQLAAFLGEPAFAELLDCTEEDDA